MITQAEWDDLIADYPAGTRVSGVVESCQVFGVFVRLDQLPNVTALLELIHFAQVKQILRAALNFLGTILQSEPESRPAS